MPMQLPQLRSLFFGWGVLSSLALSARPPEEAAEWRTLSGQKAIVRYVPADERNASLVLGKVETAYSTISSELGLGQTTVLQVVLTPSGDKFASLTHGRLPQWAAGATTLEAQGPVIYLPSPRWGASGKELHQTIVHEVAHALVAVASNYQPLPRWLTEGLAIHFSREHQWTSPAQVSRALLTNSLLRLDEVEELNRFSENRARLAYQESFLAVQYLLQTYGMDAMRAILARAAQGLDIDAAFEYAIDRDTWEFEQEWIKHVRGKYRWAFLAELGWPLWTLIVALAVVAFVGVRLRSRRTLRAWQEEMGTDQETQPWESN